MTRDDLRQFIAANRLAVLSTVTPAGASQSALVGVATTPDLEIIFDTVKTSRKYANLIANPRCSVVVGCIGEATLQYEGEARELSGDDRERCLESYFAT